jgi:hypothetical protein
MHETKVREFIKKFGHGIFLPPNYFGYRIEEKLAAPDDSEE